MKYKLISRNDFFMPVETVLENRGITKDLFKLDKDVIEDYNNYDNMQEGIELLLKHLNNNGKINLVVDSDNDGMASFAIIYLYIKDIYPNANLEMLIHTGKQHGLSKDIAINDNCNLVILTDSSSNDFVQHKQLKDRKIDVLVIDHHNCDLGYSKDAIVINNQLSKNITNKELCGAGVTLKFIKAMDDYLFENKSDKYYDLAMWGNIADMMDLHSKETRYFVYEGLKNVNNLFLKAIMELKSFELDGKFNISSIGWVIAPLINATIRSGTQEEKLKMVQAFISNDYDFCLEIAKMCKNVKSRQDSAVKSALKKIELKINITPQDRCIILDVGKTLKQEHTGLVAGKIADKYKLPTLLYRIKEGKEDIIGGSGRGIESITEDFRNDLLTSELVLMSQGHNSAFGFELKKENVNKLNKYLNNLYKDKEVTDSKEYQVDFILEENEIDEYIINELAMIEDEFGNGIDMPLILFKDVELNLTEDNKKGKLNIVFYINDIKFIKKFATNKLKEELINQSLNVDIIGKCVMDTYNNSGMVEIVDLEIK
jgi:single-stranded-DNA-specific exonuclease